MFSRAKFMDVSTNPLYSLYEIQSPVLGPFDNFIPLEPLSFHNFQSLYNP